MEDKREEEEIRLQVYLARCGIASRRASEKLITNGEVRVNGSIRTEQGVKVKPGIDRVTYRGKDIYPTKKMYYLLLNKPEKYICTHSDPQGRPLAEDLIREKVPVRLFNVGRLDFLSSGLILFTNDGDFAKIVTHPSLGIEKEYLVESGKKLSKEILDEFCRGVYVDGEKYKIKSYRFLSPVKVRLILDEGKNREIRKLFASRNLKVKRLHRVRIGTVQLGTVPRGGFRHLSQKEVSWFFAQMRKEKRS